MLSSLIRMDSGNFRVTKFSFLLIIILCSGLTLKAQSPEQIALDFLKSQADELQLSTNDLKEISISSQTHFRKAGLDNFYFQQNLNGIPVHNAVLNVHVKDGKVVSMGNTFCRGIESKIVSRSPLITQAMALMNAARHHGYITPRSLTIVENKGGAQQEVIYDKGLLSIKDIPVKLKWLPMEDGNVHLVWEVSIYEPGAKNHWQDRIDAVSGELLDKSNLVLHCNFGGDRQCENEDDHLQHHSIQTSAGQNELGMATSQYRVYQEPVESPSHGGRTLVSDPSDPVASPFGWHDTNGAAGPEFTITRGNNVHAYTDTDDDDVPDPGSSPDGGGGLVFDFPLDLNLLPSTYAPAAVTNLFYWNNYIHDFSYKYGFDEASGNFQVNNYGNGGLGGDDVLAEAQDGGGLNNANFGTPVDGQQPTMQMYLWVEDRDSVLVNSAPSKEFESGYVTVGPQEFGITGDLELVNDNVNVVTDACHALVGFTAGKIALIDRGICSSPSKIKKAQDAGAIAVILCHNLPGPPPNIGGSDPSITIPALILSQEDCDTIKLRMISGTVNVTLGRVKIYRDGDLDNGVIAHEYGHGISNRFTGGPDNVSCLDNIEQMGEGWSDFYALMTTWTGSASDRGIATYLIFQSPAGTGIRPTQYSTDMMVNPSTYDDIKTHAIPHGIGYVWASMLWELVDGLVNAHGVAAGFDEAMYLVNLGMAIQPCSPGFVDGRNAILDADTALYGGANACIIWKAFAKRGLGLSANQGSSNDRSDGTQAFDIPCDCDLSISCPADTVDYAIPGVCGKVITYSVTTTGGCDPVTLTQTDGTGYTSGQIFPVGVTNQTWMATDVNGNTVECTFTITILDDQFPIITGCPGDAFLTTDPGLCTTTHTWVAPTASDNCPGVSFASDYAPGSTFNEGSTLVTYTATDASGNTSYCTFTVYVDDDENPTLTNCPEDMNVNAQTGYCSAYIEWTDPTPDDNCGLLDFSSTHTNGSNFGVGVHNVVITATDNAENSTTCSFTITVTDNQVPNITCPSNAMRGTNEGVCKYTINAAEFNATASDNCGISPPLAYSLSGVTVGAGNTTLNGVMLNKGITTITWTATDIYANTNSCSFTVEVKDNETPKITCPPDKTVTTLPNQCTAVVALGSPTGVSDNCGVLSTTNNATNPFSVGMTMVIWTVTDVNGNTKTCNQKVTVVPYSCGAPTQVLHTDTTATTAKIKWKVGKCATAYQLRLRVQISPGVWGAWGAWVASSGPHGPPQWTHQFTGLVPAKFYNYQVRSVCGMTFSASINGWFNTLTAFAPIVDRNENDYQIADELPAQLEFIPNPAQDYTTILIEGFVSTEKIITMFDLYGKLVFNAKVEADQNLLELDLETLNVRTGVYLIRVSDAKKQKTEQLMIER
jgi:extracellular elastinolytic metalloproteinase